MQLKVESEGIVDEFLYVEGDLGTVCGGVIGEANFDGDIEEHVVIGMDVEGQSGGEESGRIEIEVKLRQARHIGVCSLYVSWGRLNDSDVLNVPAIVGFRSDVCDGGADGGRTGGERESGYELKRSGEEVVEGHLVDGAIGSAFLQTLKALLEDPIRILA